MAEQDSDIAFDEKDELAAQVGDKSAAELEKADSVAKDIANDAIIHSLSMTITAFERFRAYAEQKVKQGGVYEEFDHASELVGDLVEVAAEQMIEEVPVIGTLLKHGTLLGLRAANEHENVMDAAQDMIADMAMERNEAVGRVPSLLEEHKFEIRNAYAAAKQPSDREKAVKTTLASIGIGVPKADAAARIFQMLVEKLNLDAWIEACRSGKSGKTAECATDGAVPDIKKGAEKDAQEAFQEDDGKKQEKGKAIPRS